MKKKFVTVDQFELKMDGSSEQEKKFMQHIQQMMCDVTNKAMEGVLTPEDVEGNVVHITKAIAMGPDRKPVIKSTKTTESTRDIIIPQEVADQIRAQGFVYRGHHQYATKKMRDIEKQLGIPHFPLHKLRHYFATKMLTLTDSQTVQALGGWKTDSVMKTVYAHSMKAEQEKAKRLAVDQFSKSIF